MSRNKNNITVEFPSVALDVIEVHDEEIDNYVPTTEEYHFVNFTKYTPPKIVLYLNQTIGLTADCYSSSEIKKDSKRRLVLKSNIKTIPVKLPDVANEEKHDHEQDSEVIEKEDPDASEPETKKGNKS